MDERHGWETLRDLARQVVRCTGSTWKRARVRLLAVNNISMKLTFSEYLKSLLYYDGASEAHLSLMSVEAHVFSRGFESYRLMN
jgi:hypothetical protein